MNKFVTILTVVGLTFALASPAMANITISDLQPGNSWSILVNAGLPAFDLVGAKISSAGDVYESPGARNFSKGGWSLVIDNPTLVSIAGPATTSLSWRLYFANDADKDVTLDFAVFSGENRIWTSRYTIVNGSTSFPPSIYEASSQYWLPTRADLVPAPGAILLGSIGVGLVGWLRRRRTL